MKKQLLLFLLSSAVIHAMDESSQLHRDALQLETSLVMQQLLRPNSNFSDFRKKSQILAVHAQDSELLEGTDYVSYELHQNSIVALNQKFNSDTTIDITVTKKLGSNTFTVDTEITKKTTIAGKTICLIQKGLAQPAIVQRLKEKVNSFERTMKKELKTP